MIADGAFGRYRIEALLGEGAMARVYKAYDERHDRYVALKILKEAWRSDRDVLDRFFREARAAGALNHPNIVIIYNVESEPEPFIDMELVEGPSLAQLLKERGRLLPAQTVTIAKTLAAALEYAHSHGRVHRDVKPSNVLLARDLVTPKLTDFGIAVIDQPEAAQLTQHGDMVGTPRYMSPEQVRGERADARSDLFSLGATLYEMLTGRYAFPGETLVALSRQIVQDQPPPVRELAPETPPPVAAAVERLLEKDPKRRFQSGRELVAALEAAPGQRRRSESPKARRRVPIGAILAGIGASALGIGLAALYFWPPPTDWASATNRPPVASDDRVLSQSGEPVTIDVLANDSDPRGDALRVTSAEVLNNGPGRATVVDNKVRYEPASGSARLKQGESAQVIVGYRISDRDGATADGKIEIQLIGTGAPPASPVNRPQAVPPGGADALLTLVQEAARMPCSRIEVEDGAEGPHLVGYVGAEADQSALVARARALLGDGAIDLPVADGPVPMCPFLNLLGEKTLPNVPRLIRLVPPVDGACKSGAGCYAGLPDHRLAEGERLVLEVTTPDFPSHATVDYFTADGQVAHLAPAPDLQRSIVPADAYQISYPSGSTFFIGDRRANQGIAYPVGSPFGHEMILAVAARSPLFAAKRPEIEPAETYLADLRRALNASSRERPVASVLMLETVERSP
jgi:serine/threonine protein kinase